MDDGYDWLECPYCGNDEIRVSIRSRSVGFWCDECDSNDFVSYMGEL